MIGTRNTFDFTGTTALVTGASSGMGAVFADLLAARGADLVLVARSEQALEERAAHLRATHGRSVEVKVVDLANPTSRRALIDELSGRRIDVLVNNAGAGSHGSFAEADATRQLELVELNCAAVVELTRALLPPMLERNGGGVINVASTAGFQPTPTMATYGATKAFVLSFSLAIGEECRRKGVRVLAFCPGAVATNFGAAAGDQQFSRRYFAKAPGPEEVVPTAIDAFVAGRAVLVPGLMNRIGAFATRLAPRPLIATVTAFVLRSR